MEHIITVLFIIAGAAWAVFLLSAFFGKWIHSAANRTKWPANAIEAEAIVLKMEPTGLFVNKMPQIRLQVQVLPDKGRNFVAEINTVTPPKVKTGASIRVKYNPLNTKDLLLMHVA